ncbi:MAG TPA: protein kinase [Thermoanaerobaculia bacterium]|nr:protein kinase [Thermoanaerobaculia bacterium]
MAFYCIHCRSEIEPSYKACPHCGELITDFLRRHLESPIDGKYQILSRLGVGGMGEVYKVLHVHLNAIRVIKLMRTAIAEDPGAHERFLREARMATRISHANVGTLFDFSTLEDGSRYMVWEFIEGINVHELLEERGPLSPRYAARLSIQALQGLEAIHRAGIVHRDVSPENLMITHDSGGEERVKIIDLGIAKQWSEETDDKTKTGMFVGKWKYCSPEHLGILTEGERIDGRADIYSFGIVLYEMLTGMTPFQATTPHGYLMLHASERPRPLREVNPSVTSSPDLEGVILRALEKKRANRFASAREFAQALEAILPGLSDTPGAPAPLPLGSAETDEATNVAGRPGADAPTVVTLSQQATIGSDDATILTVAPSRLPIPAGTMRIGIGAAAALLFVIVLVAMLTGDRAEPLPEPPARPAEASIVVPAATGRLGINAFPWATVTAIRNVNTGETIALEEELVTPAPIELAPGKYEITLSNPAYRQPITRVVEVSSGRDELVNVHFADPATASLPQLLGGGR